MVTLSGTAVKTTENGRLGTHRFRNAFRDVLYGFEPPREETPARSEVDESVSWRTNLLGQ